MDFAVIETAGTGGYLLAWGNVCDATKEMSMNLKVHPKVMVITECGGHPCNSSIWVVETGKAGVFKFQGSLW